jgi:hypothetical protein
MKVLEILTLLRRNFRMHLTYRLDDLTWHPFHIILHVLPPFQD